MMCQTDWDPIRVLYAQSMAAADTETWASRSSHCCELDKKKKETVKKNFCFNKYTALKDVNKDMEDGVKKVCMLL